ncbi:MAG: hemin uptake protein HemP [Rhodoferax sp.]|nr:hemin uptake protein HemP [Rhodoferax sp.]
MMATAKAGSARTIESKPAGYPAVVAPSTPPCPGQMPVPSAELLRGQKSIAIEHQGLIYRLQVTKLGKLILTK